MTHGRALRMTALTLGFGLAAALLCSLASGQQIHRNGFELLKTGWTKGGFDTPYDEKDHSITDRVAHEGRHSEHIAIDAKAGTKPEENYIRYQYPTGKALIGEELSISVWVKANRPGLKLQARVVLPKEPDPNNLDRRLTTVIPGSMYQDVGKWQQMDISRTVQLAKTQQLLMQKSLGRSVDFTDAYIDMLVLNVYAGPGPTELWIDDVEVGPIIPDNIFQPAVRPSGPATKGNTTPTAIARPGGKNADVNFSGNHLRVGNQRFLFRGIRLTDTPLNKLREARFNTIFLEQSANTPTIREAGSLGLWVVPMVRLFGDDGKPLAADPVIREISRFSDADQLFVHVGNTLVYEQATHVGRTAQAIRAAEPGRIVGGDVWDGIQTYSRQMNVVGVHRWPLMTTLEMPKYREWLEQRSKQANPGTFLWTWIPTHMPEWYTQILYERSANASFDEPIGPQPEHIQLLAYNALASGCRGLAFWSDRWLADSHSGRDRLLACALLNLELEMLEPLLVTVDDPPEWIDTSAPDVKAAVLRSPHGVLVLPLWQGTFAQFVPGQAAVSRLSITVPQVPPSSLAWDVSPADVRSIKTERTAGGMKITLPEFGVSGAILFTADMQLVGRLQEQAKNRRQLASQWSQEMAQYALQKVLKVQEQLERQGHTTPDAKQLTEKSRTLLQSAKQHWDNRAFGAAYHESQRALRPVRILMRAQWEAAVRGLDSVTTSPYAVTFYTLPRHWDFMDKVKRATAGANVLPGGDFEAIPQKTEEAWRMDEATGLDDMDLIAQRVSEVHVPGAAAGADGKLPVLDMPKEGKQCAMLQIRPKAGRLVPQSLERTLLALSSPSVRLQPGTLVQISGWIRVPSPISASPDGALLYDSAGGEPLAVRLTDTTKWKKFTLYRRVPASGTIGVTLALTGIGTVYFDDVRIEPLVTRN